jgi:hypothetical protein
MEMNDTSTMIAYTYVVIVTSNAVVIVRQRTIPTERPPLVGEVSTNFCG